MKRRRGDDWIVIKMLDMRHGSLSDPLTNASFPQQLVLCGKKEIYHEKMTACLTVAQ